MKQTTAATALLATVGGLAIAATPEPGSNLDHTTILANRSPTELSKVGSSVTVLDTGLLEKQGIPTVDQALKFVPGVTSDSVGGQRGSTSDIYVRGLRTTHTHVVIDGMRISDTNSGFILGKQFLGSNNLGGLSRLEILRGPQGAIYGGDAIGGVLGLYTAKGSGAHSGSLGTEAGSFQSWNTRLSLQGSDGAFAYALALGHEATDNDLPHNRFEMGSYALRLDYEINSRSRAGLTLRGADATYQGPQTGMFYNGPDDTDFNYLLGTLFAEYDVCGIWTSRLTLGIFDQGSEFVSRAPTPGFPPFVPPTSPPTISYANDEDLTKYGIYWDNTLRWNERHTTVTGLVFEKSDYLFTDSFASLDERTRRQYGWYANHTWEINDCWTVSGGLRWEDFRDDGANGYNDDVVTWRVATTYTSQSTGTTFRASAGHGFRIPNYVELKGNPAFGIAPNPGLDPVESLGWDLGVEQAFCGGRYTVGVTYFGNRLENAIANPANTQYVNLPGSTETSGIEASAGAHFLDERLTFALTYTWLDRALVDIPENTAGLRVHAKISDRLDAGASATYLDSRSYGGNSLDPYWLANLYASYKVNDNIALNMRVENVFDKNYEHFNGFGSSFPGRGRGIFGGITLSW